MAIVGVGLNIADAAQEVAIDRGRLLAAANASNNFAAYNRWEAIDATLNMVVYFVGYGAEIGIGFLALAARTGLVAAERARMVSRSTDRVN
jgi:hypothetical protein